MGFAADDIWTEIPVTSEKGGKYQRYVPQKCFNFPLRGGVLLMHIPSA